MIRFLLMLAALTAYSSAYSQEKQNINAIEAVDRGYHGESERYYSNGDVREKGNYYPGELHDVSQIYDVDGSLFSWENFTMGSRTARAECLLKAQRQSNLRLNVGMTYE